MPSNERIIIIGGGLSGLTLAYLLATRKNKNTTILEGSSRIGGRIQTIKGNLNTPLELGATWFSEIHPNVLALIDELGLQKYPQFSEGISLFQTKSFEPPQKFFIPAAEQPSYRLVGGTQFLIDTLAAKIAPENIVLNTRVREIKDCGNELQLTMANGDLLLADKVILCIPPQLAGTEILFSPALPSAVATILPTVQTWMSGAVKFVLEYETPFWRNNGYSGMLYSHAGIIAEMYDHTNFEKNKYGFTGFLNGAASSYTQTVRKELVLQQLAKLMGEEVLTPTLYTDKIWTDKFITSGKQLIHQPHQNNGHPLLQQSYMNGKLHFSGTETAVAFSGYMEGAIIAAKAIADSLPA